MRSVSCDRRIAATVDQWDADVWSLNTPTGVVDLQTGQLNKHDPLDFMTKKTAVAPGNDCPLWHEVLHTITCGDRDLEGYLQRVCGYALTGLTREQVLIFLYGAGANGKSVFINTVAAIMGDYAGIAATETFLASKLPQHTTDLAALRGARLVTASETEEGRPWAESRIKSLTGGDPISARFMRQDNFTFTPQYADGFSLCRSKPLFPRQTRTRSCSKN